MFETSLANLKLPKALVLDSAVRVADAETNSVYACRGRLGGIATECYLKIADRGARSLANERDTLRRLRDCAIRVPAVIADCVEHDPPFLLLAKVHGASLLDLIDPRRARRDVETVLGHLRTYGETLAAVHAIDPGGWAEQPRSRLETVASIDGELDPRVQRLVEWLEAHRPSRAERAFVHGDFNTANVLIDADGSAGVIDWEFAGRGWKEHELAWALRARLHFLNTPAERAAILEGYASSGTFDAEQLQWCEVLTYVQFAQWTRATNAAYSEFALARAESMR